MKILGVIPARYASTRFPAKLLQKVGEKTVIQCVYEQCLKAKSLSKVVVATDHELIFKHVESFGGTAVMTGENHESGTDRCAETLAKYGGVPAFNFVVNIQGDEPLIAPETINALCEILNEETEIASACKKITNSEDIFNINVVKIVKNLANEALYFSRSAIPNSRDEKLDSWHLQTPYFKHIGLYAFKSVVLERLVKLPMSSLEKTEKLEQLRWLENGFKIKMIETDYESKGIDTPEDLENLNNLLRQKNV